MSKVSQYLILSASIFLVACQGESSDNEDVNNDPESVMCPSGETFDINGIELETDTYDIDNNGCLSDIEHQTAIRVAALILEQQENGLEVDGGNTASGISTVKTMKVIGSSEVSDGKIQLHTNIDSGKIHISFTTYTTGSDDERLKLYFDDESAVGKSGTTPPYAMTFPIPPLVGNISYAFGCRYLSSMSVNCTTLVVTETENIGSSVMTLDIDVTFPLQLTFSGQSLPQTGYIIGTFCDESAICLDNYAEVPVSFN